MQMNLRKALLDAAQHLFVPVDLQIGMQSALHQHAGAAEFDRLANLFVDGIEVEDVAFFRCRSLQRTVKRAEGAIFGAEVRVIDVAVDDVGDHALGMQLAPHGVRFHPDADQVVGPKNLESLLFGQRHKCDRPVTILSEAAGGSNSRNRCVPNETGFRLIVRLRASQAAASLNRCSLPAQILPSSHEPPPR